MVVVDRFTKYVHFIALSYPYSAPKVAHLFAQHILKLHGMPTSLISDKDPVITAKFGLSWWGSREFNWQCLLLTIIRLMGKLRLSTRVWNIISGPSLLTDLQSGDWLYLAEFWFNINFHTATKFTPFEAFYGTAPPRLLDYILGTT